MRRGVHEFVDWAFDHPSLFWLMVVLGTILGIFSRLVGIAIGEAVARAWL